MEKTKAIRQLSALAQDGRLSVFRLLVKTGKKGLSAGDIARKLKVAPNTLSAQFGILTNAGLLTSRRDGRSVIYTVNFEAMGSLLVFLMEDCCEGRPEVCAPVANAARCVASCKTGPVQ
jgi:DNA-binding transcriptional ArsR family regulator